MTDRERAARALQLVGGPIELLIQRVAKEIGEARIEAADEERKACQALCDGKDEYYSERGMIGMSDGANDCSQAIRARGTESKTGGR